jgi:NADH-quinone oxidoreductase subunit N
MPQINLYPILPTVVLVSWASVLLILHSFFFKRRAGWTALLAVLGFALTLGIVIAQAGVSDTAFSGMVALDGYATFLQALLVLTGLFGVALAYNYLPRMELPRQGEYYVLIMFSVSGMMLMAQATDLILVFLALELLSIPLYVLSALATPRPSSEEAGLKYLLLGSFATGFLVYGIALTFGATGSTSLVNIGAAVSAGTANMSLLLIGAALILIGFGFKIAVVPFHMWTPDVYQGAPTSVTAFMAAGAKTAGFAALLRVFVTAFPGVAADLTNVLWALAAVTMVVGNLLAISQSNIKRMLAYSSIAQAGYILMAFVPFANVDVMPVSIAAGLFYLAAYTFTSFGAWAVVIALEKANEQGLEISDYAGLGRSHPALAAAMTIFMLSLTGIPPTLGLIGKFYLFRAVIDGGFIWLAVIGVVTSLISAFYYLRVIVTMYMKEGTPQVTSETALNFTWGAAAVITVVFSFVPAPLFTWASQAFIR